MLGGGPDGHTPPVARRVSELERPQCNCPALGPFLLGLGGNARSTQASTCHRLTMALASRVSESLSFSFSLLSLNIFCVLLQDLGTLVGRHDPKRTRRFKLGHEGSNTDSTRFPVLAELGHSPIQNRPLLDSKTEFNGLGGLRNHIRNRAALLPRHI
jgi:hypothetical protein